MGVSVLVTGGAGYIGSHMVQMLQERGDRITTFDNLSQGSRKMVIAGEFIKGDLRNPQDLVELFGNRSFDVVMHFGALAYVGESVRKPRDYYENNVIGTRNLLNIMLDTGVDKLVFSSTCATYGIPEQVPIDEDCLQMPINPYGRTKLFTEGILADYGTAYGLKSVSLRYFNAAGCDPRGVLGERHHPETHLIPLVLLEALRIHRGGDPSDTRLNIFGDDFDTPDGTCIRDYIHVSDICTAHIAAMERLLDKEMVGAEVYNLGNGNGFSVEEVIDVCRRVTGVDIRFRISDRRAGDPPVLVGSAVKAKKVLNWQAQYADLERIVETAWQWFQRHE